MPPDNKTVILSTIGVVFFCIWSAMAYYDHSLRPGYLKLIMSGVALVGIAVRDLLNTPSPPPPPPPAPTQPVPPTVAKE